MTSERWAQIEQLYHAARARSERERAAFLAAACADDEALRREVASLLAQPASGDGFLEAPAMSLAAHLVSEGGGSGLIGRRLGVFHVKSRLGAGGMGEVYRAYDTRLKREVALKVLPDAFSQDRDRLARFQREAELLATLNHPNIAAVYGLEQADPSPGSGQAAMTALILELVEGETLADRLARGSRLKTQGLPLDEALPIARQIADALEAAHEKGVIHRDLKPANIKVTPDGRVKVLDFGLAKLTQASGSALRAPGELSDSPTITPPALMTEAGMILGTAAYMSPEQARGKPVDKRSDIWAFGCVLYEMLTGRRPFAGESVTDTLTLIITKEPDWSPLPGQTPSAIRRLLRRALAKDRNERLADIADARIELKDALTAGRDDAAGAVQALPISLKRRFAPVLGAVVVTAVAVGVGTWILKPAAPAVQPSVTRSVIAVEPFNQRTPANPGQNRPPGPIRPFRTAVALSPDGRTLVFRGTRDAGGQLFIRPLDRLEATPIPGTDGANSPFFSPDGTWIGFWANGELRKVPVGGGPASTIGRVPGPSLAVYGASWGDGDVIVFATRAGLWRLPARGGRPEAVSVPSEVEYAEYLPRLLPGGEAILYTLAKTAFRWDNAQIVVRSLVTGTQKVLIDDGADARYVPTGHLVFVRRGVLMAAPFDLPRLELTGGPVALVDGVMQSTNQPNTDTDSGAAQFAVADRGTLVYVTGGIAHDQERELVWVDRNGLFDLLTPLRREFLAPRLAPDRKRIAVTTQPSGATAGHRVWIYDLPRRMLTPLTTLDEAALWNVWSPDGARVAFSSEVAGKLNVFWKSADGTGTSERLTTSEYLSPNSWSPDGKTLAFVQNHPATARDIWVVDVGSSDRSPRPLMQTPASESFPAFSTDGRWLAYTSDDSGRQEVYVQRYPGPGPRVVVSTDGGTSPAWRSDGSELFYFKTLPENYMRMMVAPVKATAAGFSSGTPRKLFEGRYVMADPVRGYDVTPDGQRFLMVRPLDPPPEPATELVLVENWFEELKARVPVTP
jgi:serine/threonine protein kinase/Tol biopolymer transport system component